MYNTPLTTLMIQYSACNNILMFYRMDTGYQGDTWDTNHEEIHVKTFEEQGDTWDIDYEEVPVKTFEERIRECKW